MNQEKTREVIATSFYNLSKTYDFSDISVNMICKESGISRSTFYRHFKDKYDVLIAFFELRHSTIDKAYPDAKDLRFRMLYFLEFVSEYNDFFNAYLSRFDQNSLRDHLYTLGVNFYVEQIEKTAGEISNSLRIKVILFSSGLLSLFVRWTQHEFSISPQELTDVIIESMPPEMAQYFVD